jgi:hypothetical protein
MTVRIDPRDQRLYEAVFPPEQAKNFAGLFGLAKRIDARLKREGKQGLFERHLQKKAGLQ